MQSGATVCCLVFFVGGLLPPDRSQTLLSLYATTRCPCTRLYRLPGRAPYHGSSARRTRS
eukprot:5497519-Alexandrium_andersonii.AAC.1